MLSFIPVMPVVMGGKTGFSHWSCQMDLWHQHIGPCDILKSDFAMNGVTSFCHDEVEIYMDLPS